MDFGKTPNVSQLCKIWVIEFCFGEYDSWCLSHQVTFIWYEKHFILSVLHVTPSPYSRISADVFSWFTCFHFANVFFSPMGCKATEHMVLSLSEREELPTHLSRPWPSNNSTFLKEKNRKACEKWNIASLVIWEFSLSNCRYVKPVILAKPEKSPLMQGRCWQSRDLCLGLIHKGKWPTLTLNTCCMPTARVTGTVFKCIAVSPHACSPCTANHVVWWTQRASAGLAVYCSRVYQWQILLSVYLEKLYLAVILKITLIWAITYLL